MREAKIDSPRGPISFSKSQEVVQNIYLRKATGGLNKVTGIAVENLADPGTGCKLSMIERRSQACPSSASGARFGDRLQHHVGPGMSVFLAQLLNGLQYGLLLFLIASGLTLIFGVLRRHQSGPWQPVHDGRLCGVPGRAHTGSLWLALPVAIRPESLLGLLLERFLFRYFYDARASRSGPADLRADPAVRGVSLAAGRQ